MNKKFIGQLFLDSLLIWDKLIALVMVILVIGVGVTSYRLASAPVYFVVTVTAGGTISGYCEIGS